MEILTEKIKEAERFRDRYYEDHPSSTVAEKSKAVKEKVIPLLQDIPLETHGSSSLSAEHSLLCGRILNICIEYDPRCEKHLIQAIKLNPHLADAWHELGECLWKKKDCEAAVDCFKKSLSHERTAKSMCALSSALRQLAVSTGDKKKQEELREEATRLCAEAVRIESGSGVAWHAFGNSLLTDFFAKGQSDEQILWLPSLAVPGRRSAVQSGFCWLSGTALEHILRCCSPRRSRDGTGPRRRPTSAEWLPSLAVPGRRSAVQSGFCWLSGTALEHILRCCSPRRSRDGTGPRRRPTSAEKNAREAYEKALTIDEGRLNADLHLNYATALEFEQDYARCLRHMHIASSSDPELFGAKEKYETLCSFLMRLSEAVRRKACKNLRILYVHQMCIQKSLSHERTAKSMCALSSALRQLAVSTGDKKKQEELREEATRLCAEAVRIESGSGVAWHAFGNSLLTDFFAKGQSDEQILWLPSLAVPGRRSAVQSGFCWLSGTALEHILRCCSPRRSRDGTGPRRRPTSAEKNAREAYEKALTIDEGRLNADLHLNYATALEFEQDYARCLRHMHIASSSDPELFGAKEKYETLCSFLMRLSEAVRRKGKLKAKRLLEFQRSLSKTECSQYQSFSVRSKNSEKRASREADFDSLHEGLNENIIIAGKVVGIVPNPDSIPFAFVGCDKNGSCLAFTVYNFSPKFGMVIGDSFAVADPFIVDVEASAVDEVCCDHLPVDGQIRFRAVRIPSPHVLLKNGKGVSVDSVAFCEVGSTCTL
ncbi:Tetratricopeptide repeat protein 5 [Toxocara canis]|uniref:Tetratricopeptide repeat protein 5 n=1 Tax=Toxocara canis TaxID=6265 RepID=A0A0B2V531_TOXCA|nr:Tetratricopeptide repeat protein 5 [Toxocara canis]